MTGMVNTECGIAVNAATYTTQKVFAHPDHVRVRNHLSIELRQIEAHLLSVCRQVFVG